MLRKLFLAAFAACVICGVARAEEQPGTAESMTGPMRVYIEIVGVNQLFSSKKNVSVDYGQASAWWNGVDRGKLVDENGKEIKFNSMIDAMNYLSERGWTFQQAYVVTHGSRDDVNSDVHWLLYKDVSDPSEITDGLMIKGNRR